MRRRIRRLFSRYGKKAWIFIVLGAVIVVSLGGGAYAALGGFGRPQAVSDIELQRGLVGWWKLNGNAKDSTPYGDNGTVNGPTLTADREGKANSAYNFSANTDNIAIPNNSVLNSSVFTYAAWVKPTDFSTAHTIIGSSSNSGPQFKINITSGKLELGVQNVVAISDTSVALTANVWSHVAVTYDPSGNFTFYINGVQVPTVNTPPNLQSFTFSNFLIGKKASTVDTMVGAMSDVRIYNRVLSSAEVAALASQYNSAANAGSGENGLVGWWKMDGNTKDSTPYAHDATLSATQPIPVADREGAANSAYSFSGVSGGSSFNIPGSAMPTSQISFSLWLEQTSWANYYDLATLNFGTLSNATGWDLSSDSTGTPKFSLKESTTGTSSGTCPAGSLTLNKWHHLVGTYDGSTVRLYLDGSLCTVAQNTYSGDPLSNTGTLVLGERGQGTTHYMDDARVYNRALSSSEVAALYNSYNSQINLQSSPSGSGTIGNINQGLTGYWGFNGNAKDSTPYGDNGTVNGAMLTSDRFGHANGAYAFNTSTDVVSIPDASAIDPGSTMSLAVWIKLNTVSHQVERFADKLNSAGYSLYQTQAGTGDTCGSSNICWKVRINGAYQVISTPLSGLTAGNWYDVVGTFDGTYLRLYINGSLVATSANVAGPITASTTPLCIGISANATSCSTSNPFTGGSVDEVRVYNRALSASEVQTLYQSAN